MKNSDQLSNLEVRALSLIQVYKTFTAEQISEALGITWDEANDLLYHFQYSHDFVTPIQHHIKDTEFKMAEWKNEDIIAAISETMNLDSSVIKQRVAVES